MEKKEAMKILKDFHDKSALFSVRTALDTVFPEFVESEDERIRKKLIDYFKSFTSETFFNGVPTKNALAWLEKQGENNMGISEATKQELEDNLNRALEKETPESCNEFLEKQAEQKHADKVEPKFKIGDYIVNDYCAGKVVALTDDAYLLDTEQGIPFSCEHNVHLWTIKDAKEGDVLFLDLMYGKTFIYNGVNSDMSILYSFIISNDGKDVLPYHIGRPNTGIGNIEENKGIIRPATKEQRDLLFKKMKEAGYKWDDEKKELKKIHVIDEGKAEMDYCFTKMMAGEKVSLTWSEEDIIHLNNCISYMSRLNASEMDWLKSLRPQNRWKPSDEQIKVCKEVYADILSAKGFDLGTVNGELNRLEEELKKLREE